MPVFRRRIENKIQNSIKGRKTKRVLSRKASQLTEKAKDMLDEDIDFDSVSQKIDGDPKTIGYFGFEEGDQPVENFKRVMEGSISLNPRPKIKQRGKQTTYTYNIKFPSRREIYSESILALPWISKSWVEGVMEGLSGVERFAFKPGKGRSEFGIQLKGNVQDQITPLKDPDYIDRIRNRFSENLRKAGL